MQGYNFRKRSKGGWEFIEFPKVEEPQTTVPVLTTWVPSREIEIIGRSDGLLIPTRWPTFITSEDVGERILERQSNEERLYREAEEELEQERSLQIRMAPRRKQSEKGASGESSSKKRRG